MASLPLGAMPDDTAEYMLGKVAVNVVFMESDQSLAPYDVSTENWTQAHRAETKQKIEAGLKWWQDMLATQNSAHTGDLSFAVDYQYADKPVRTGYEAINRRSNDFNRWVYSFFNQVGYNKTGDFSKDSYAYNNALRLSQNADWAFTIFVVNSDQDEDDQFASGGSFSRAFSYAGGRFIVVPSGRPAQTIAHEVGHMFWARDEYYGGGSYTDKRGYYDTQNLNAQDNPATDFVHQDSIMSSAASMESAYENDVTDPWALSMIGWQDSDQDGIFDVLDVPHRLSGSGSYASSEKTYRFIGSASAQALPNINSSGLQNDITIGRISRLQYRLDSGNWLTAASYGSSSVEIDVTIPNVPNFSSIELRVIDDATGVVSPSFFGTPSAIHTTVLPGVNGTVWNDNNSDTVWQAGERGVRGWQIQVVDANGTLVPLQKSFEPDAYTSGIDIRTASPSVMFTALGTADGIVGVNTADFASTGEKVFVSNSKLYGWNPVWTGTTRLKATFASSVSEVRIDAIGNSANDYGRLEAYDAQGQLLGRYTTLALNAGDIETMLVKRATDDIAYIIAEGHAGSGLLLDNLRYGPESTAVSNNQGAYSLTGLPSGSYRLRAVPPSDWNGDPVADQEVTLAEGESLASIDFITHRDAPLWQNPADPIDVDNDGIIAALDAILVINHLNAKLAGPFPLHGGPAAPPPFLDVSGDDTLSPLDAVMVINYLNGRNPAGSNGGSGGNNGGSSGGSGGEGELPQLTTSSHIVMLTASTGLVGPSNNAPGSATSQVPPGVNILFLEPQPTGIPFVQRVHQQLQAAAQGNPWLASMPMPTSASTTVLNTPALESILNDLADDVSRVHATPGKSNSGSLSQYFDFEEDHHDHTHDDTSPC